MPDARGHGESSVPDYGYRYEDYANDVIELIKSLSLPPVFLIGHSMGGMTAALVASISPKLVCGLILADPTFIDLKTQYEVYESDVVEKHKQVLNKSFNQLVTEERVRHPKRSLDNIELIAHAKLKTSIAAFDVLIPPNPDYKKLMKSINIPSLIIFGGKGIISSIVAKELQDLNTMISIVQIPEAFHGIHYDQLESFTFITHSFINSINI